MAEFLQRIVLTTADPGIFAVLAKLDCGHQRYKTGLSRKLLDEVLQLPFANCLQCNPAPEVKPQARPQSELARKVENAIKDEQAALKLAWKMMVRGLD